MYIFLPTFRCSHCYLNNFFYVVDQVARKGGVSAAGEVLHAVALLPTPPLQGLHCIVGIVWLRELRFVYPFCENVNDLKHVCDSFLHRYLNTKNQGC